VRQTAPRARVIRAADYAACAGDSCGGDHLILVPKKLIDKSQAYFWTREWQAAEREAQEGIDEDRVEEFESVDHLIADLHSRK
jgi:hypothetical protein